jgi:ribonucleoside-diphosphate reductase alpha chain
VFDCANRCGKNGERFIHYEGHIKMMGAAQPFISGAISKTINMPTEVRVEDIEQAYLEGWRLGLKSLALYRDGSKSSQPLNAKNGAGQRNAEAAKDNPAAGENSGSSAAAVSPAMGPALRPIRRRLPKRRLGFTQEARVGGTKVYLRTGEYEDGTIGEIFIDLAKEGAALRSMMNCFAISVSLGLQHGVPLKEFVDCFTFTRFEPQGRVTGHPNIKMATSVVDYLFRVLDLEYHGNTDLVHVKPGALEKQEIRQNATAGSAPAPAPAPAKPAREAPAQGAGSPGGSAKPNGAGSGGNPGTAGNGGTGHPAEEAGRKGSEKASERGSEKGNGNGSTVRLREVSPTPIAEAAVGTLPGKFADPDSGGSRPFPGPAANAAFSANVVDEHLGNMMGDAPFCDVCGHITVRNGSCYRCLNCGNSMGCS